MSLEAASTAWKRIIGAKMAAISAKFFIVLLPLLLLLPGGLQLEEDDQSASSGDLCLISILLAAVKPMFVFFRAQLIPLMLA